MVPDFQAHREFTMFASQTHRMDFADTRATAAESVLTFTAFGRFEAVDPLEQMALADRADRTLLQLVLCAAAATLVLALAASVGV